MQVGTFSPNNQANEGLERRPEAELGLVGVTEEDIVRARLYGLLSRVLATAMSDETLEITRGLAKAGDQSEVWSALNRIGEVAIRTPRASAEEEYTVLFHGMGSGGEVQPYLSYYLTGFVFALVC